MSNTQKADDKPFDFNLEAYVRNLKLPPFRFHWGDRRWEMVHFDALDSAETKRAIQKEDDDEVLRLAMGEPQFAEFEQIPINNGGKAEMVKQYFKHSGVDVGELRGSTGS